MKRQLGMFEHALTLTGQFGPFAAVGVLRLQPGPEPDALRRALAHLQQRQPLLRAQVVAQGGRYFFEFSPNAPPIPVRVVARQDSAHWQRVATEALNATPDIGSAPLMRCTYLYQSGRDALVELVFAYHHVIMDAASGLHFYHRLLSLCAGTADDLPAESLTMRPSADALFPPNATGWRRAGKVLGYVARQVGDEIQYRRELGNGRIPPIHPTARCRILTRQFDKATTRAIVRKSRRERVTMYNILSTAMLLAVHKHLYHNEARPLRAMTFADLRPFLHPPVPNKYLGCYISMLRHTINLNESPDFWPTVRTFQEMATQSARRGEKFAAALLSNVLIKSVTRFQSFRMGVTAVSYAGPVKLKPTYGRTQVIGLHGFISNNQLGPEYTAFAKILHGQLSWDFLYLDSDMDQALAETIADETNSILAASTRL